MCLFCNLSICYREVKCPHNFKPVYLKFLQEEVALQCISCMVNGRFLIPNEFILKNLTAIHWIALLWIPRIINNPLQKTEQQIAETEKREKLCLHD